MNIEIKMEGMDRLLRNLDGIKEGLSGKAMVMAINKTAAKGKTEMARAIRDEYMVTVSEVRPKLRVAKARRGQLSATIDPFGKYRGRSLNLIHFMERKVTVAQHRKRQKAGDRQLRFKIKRHGPAKVVKGAFVGNRGRTIFRRRGAARLPIDAVQTVGVPSMFNARKVKSRVVARIRKELRVETERAVAQVLRRHAK